MGVTLYKETDTLEDKVFKNPPSEYRGTPFWAWNGRLDKKLLFEQIDAFRKMGLGGAHLHVRTGLQNEYLGDEHMEMVSACTEKFKKEKMLSWLYDEDRWPSGAAGGIVTKNKKYRRKFVRISTKELPIDDMRTLAAVYDVVLDEKGYLKEYSKIDKDDCAKGTKWFAYFEIERYNSSWFNGQCYLDTMDRESVREFINVTHERYYNVKDIGKEFGKTIKAIFTDEPYVGDKELFEHSHDKCDRAIPFTTRLPKEYKKAYGADIFDTIPEIFWDKKDSVSIARYRYYDIVVELFSDAFSDQIGAWCEKHGILMTGHVLYEGDLFNQASRNGDCMRSYRSFGLPGIDMLCNAHEYSSAKQCQSISHQDGRCGMLSELYGVTNWDHDFRGHKHQGDWQAALGVTTRVHHLAFYSMEGEAKRDYPASISYQSPWYERYSYIEDHFARVNTALTRGKADVKVAVIHPIETAWIYNGPNDLSSDKKIQIEENFQNTVKWLLFGNIDFDFICEATLPKQCRKASNPLKVGEMKYDVVVVSTCETLRSTTLERLEAFREAGGKIVFMGNAPTLCDAVPSTRAKELYDKCVSVPFGKVELLRALEENRDISIVLSNGVTADRYLYQMRKEKNGTKWLFIANGKNYSNIDISYFEDVVLSINGKYTPTLYDTLTGKITKIPFEIKDGKTVITRRMYSYDSLLLKLEKYTPGTEYAEKQKKIAKTEIIKIPTKVDYSLSEKNVYVLDVAEYKVNDGKWNEKEEILRLDNKSREILGWPHFEGHMVQPWVTPEAPITNFVTLRFEIESEIEVAAPVLAIEKANDVKVVLNGKKVAAKPLPDDYYVDRYIGKIPLPKLTSGKNVLEVTCPIGERTAIEYAYLLGDFGVYAKGCDKFITALPEKLYFDDIRNQGLAFYSANIDYKYDFESTLSGDLVVRAPVYRGALISVRLDGKDCGNIVFTPYSLTIPKVAAGKHTIEFTYYGTRFNTFGELHCHHNEALTWYGPGAYRTEGDLWYYEYETKPAGILRAPSAIIEK